MTEIYFLNVKTVIKICLKMDGMETDGRLTRGNGSLEGVGNRRTFQLHEVTPEMRRGHRVVRLHDKISVNEKETRGIGFTGEVYLLPNRTVNVTGNRNRPGKL